MIELKDEPILHQWLDQSYVDPGPLAEDALARPHVRYLVLDNFLNEQALNALAKYFARCEFAADNEGLNYDSESSQIQNPELLHFLHSPAWVEWLHVALHVPQPKRSRPLTVARRHASGAHGFWPHVDDFPGDPKRIAFITYLSPDWRKEHGGWLQFWQPLSRESKRNGNVLRWDDWLGRRLDFLENEHELVLELGGPYQRPVTRIRLIDQIVPLYNRAVLIALRSRPAIHSVTPSDSRDRYALFQWIS